MAVSCMRHASGHNYSNSSFIVDVAMGQMPNSIRFDSIQPISSVAQLLRVSWLSGHPKNSSWGVRCPKMSAYLVTCK